MGECTLRWQVLSQTACSSVAIVVARSCLKVSPDLTAKTEVGGSHRENFHIAMDLPLLLCIYCPKMSIQYRVGHIKRIRHTRAKPRLGISQWWHGILLPVTGPGAIQECTSRERYEVLSDWVWWRHQSTTEDSVFWSDPSAWPSLEAYLHIPSRQRWASAEVTSYPYNLLKHVYK